MLSVIAPCFNEEANVEELVDRTYRALLGENIEFEIILVDDGSTDQTWEKLKQIKNKNALVRIEKLEKNLGIVQAWRVGIQKSNGWLVCLIDSDLQNPPEEIAKLYKTKVSSNANFVQGFRVPETSDRKRVIYSKTLNKILNFFFKDNAKDNKSGFLIADRDSLILSLNHKLKYNFFQTFIRVSAKSHGFDFIEVPTKFVPRVKGKSFISGTKVLQVPLLVIFEIFKAFLEFRLMRLKWKK